MHLLARGLQRGSSHRRLVSTGTKFVNYEGPPGKVIHLGGDGGGVVRSAIVSATSVSAVLQICSEAKTLDDIALVAAFIGWGSYALPEIGRQ